MNNAYKPIILREGTYSAKDIDNLKKRYRIWEERDIYEAQLKEYFEITHAYLLGSPNYDAELNRYIKSVLSVDRLKGDWAYFPWSGLLVHLIRQEEYFALRTNRNRNLITAEEQHLLSESCIGIIGLSVGSNVATTLVYSGIGKVFKLAEFDVLETTNLNRIRARIDQIYIKKIDLTARQIYEIDPFAEIITFEEGLSKDLLTSFLTHEPKPKVIFEIIDGFEMKIHLRALAREAGIPVIMITNLGDRVLIDVERYDLNRNLEFFNGRAGRLPYEMLAHPDITTAEKHKYAVDLAGTSHIPPRALESVAEIGKTLVGRPQLASTVMTATGFSVYLAKKILLGHELPSRSWLIDLDKLFDKENSL
ncbi:MAG: UBA/THIF-type NAD/FAD binding protein [Parcubacteria group bacterium Gr01-1014_33]|nr:MAG: UBA/THIF-type NAD/FAD binding protein [Parcubacteria group bacterium Gr01-1014_33]